MIKALKEKFNSINQAERYCRIENHPLDIFVGKDEFERYTLLWITKDKPKKIESSKVMFTFQRLRKDKKWVTIITLSDLNYIEVFLNFCNDLISSSKNIKKEEASKFICERYLMWQQMLKTYNQGLLSFIEIKGLIGELLYLKDYLFENIGICNAIDSWVGPLGSDQDFHFKNHWFEVKTTSPGSNKVVVSSVEQLDSIESGHLIIFYLDKTSKTDFKKISLNSLVDEIKDKLTNDYKQKFEDILIYKGYFKRIEYDEYIFRLVETETYSVQVDFPCIRKNDLPYTVGKIKYELLLSTIKKYKENNNGIKGI